MRHYVSIRNCGSGGDDCRNDCQQGIRDHEYHNFPMPEVVRFNDIEGLSEYMDSLPFFAFLIVFVAHLNQAFVGGWVAARISTDKLMTVALIVGVLSLIAGIINMVNLWSSVPSWMLIELPLYLVAAWGAAKLEQRRRNTSN